MERERDKREWLWELKKRGEKGKERKKEVTMTIDKDLKLFLFPTTKIRDYL